MKRAEAEERRREVALALVVAVEAWRRKRYGFDRSVRRRVEEALDVSLAAVSSAGVSGGGFVDRFVQLCIAESDAWNDPDIHEEIASYCAIELRRWVRGDVRAEDLSGADGSTLPRRFWAPPESEKGER